MDATIGEIRLIVIGDRVASIELESDFWECLEQIAERAGATVDGLATEIGDGAEVERLPAALRVFVLYYYWGRNDGRDQFREGIVNSFSLAKLADNKTLH